MKVLSGVRILCVDDSSDSLELLRHVLARYGADVTTCASAEKAIIILRSENFDMMVSDLSMPPGLDGYDLVHALRDLESENPDREVMPAIAVSGDAMRSSKKRRFADFQVYMPKPVNKKRLIYVVERLLQADGSATEFGSLDNWEADQATQAALTATAVAATATAAAVEATVAASNATVAAVDATRAAADAKATALEAEKKADEASSRAPGNV
jgi:CheY-like chemotaxis protein